MEDKGWTLALHGRWAEDAEARRILGEAGRVASSTASSTDFRILHEYKFLEIAPTSASKRETVAYLLEQYPFAEARLLYIGDDIKDEEAFGVIHAHGGAAVRVLPSSQSQPKTSADFVFASPAATIHWLRGLL